MSVKQVLVSLNSCEMSPIASCKNVVDIHREAMRTAKHPKGVPRLHQKWWPTPSKLAWTRIWKACCCLHLTGMHPVLKGRWLIAVPGLAKYWDMIVSYESCRFLVYLLKWACLYAQKRVSRLLFDVYIEYITVDRRPECAVYISFEFSASLRLVSMPVHGCSMIYHNIAAR